MLLSDFRAFETAPSNGFSKSTVCSLVSNTFAFLESVSKSSYGIWPQQSSVMTGFIMSSSLRTSDSLLVKLRELSPQIYSCTKGLSDSLVPIILSSGSIQIPEPTLKLTDSRLSLIIYVDECLPFSTQFLTILTNFVFLFLPLVPSF